MKKRPFKLALALIGVTATLQVHAQHAIPAAGTEATGTGGTASFTVGQVLYKTVSGTGHIETQGVQQPYEIFLVGLKETKGISLTCSVYPNPAVSVVNLEVENLLQEDLSFSLFDMNGKLILSQAITEKLTRIPFESIASGAYFLKVSMLNNADLQTFKIIKNQ